MHNSDLIDQTSTAHTLSNEIGNRLDSNMFSWATEMCSFSEGQAGQEHNYEAETSVAQSASQRLQSHPRRVQQILFKVQMIIKNS